MRHPLTSKERRGLTAVAAAALLCIGMGFGYRSCSGAEAGGRAGAEAGKPPVHGEDTVGVEAGKPPVHEGDTVGVEAGKSQVHKGVKRAVRKKTSSGKKSEKVYPVREPLDEPCD